MARTTTDTTLQATGRTLYPGPAFRRLEVGPDGVCLAHLVTGDGTPVVVRLPEP